MADPIGMITASHWSKSLMAIPVRAEAARISPQFLQDLAPSVCVLPQLGQFIVVLCDV